MSRLLLLLAIVPARHDEAVGPLVGAGLLAFGREAPRGDGVASARGAAFAAPVRVVDRVHGDAAIVRALAEPPVAAGLADRDVHVVRVRHRANRREAAAMDEALLARVQADRDVALVARDDLGVGPGRAGQGAAFPELELDVVDDRAHGHVADRHGVARLNVDLIAGDDLVAGREPLRGEDVGQLAVGKADERDERRAVRIVFDPLDRRRLARMLAALEIHVAIGLLVAAAAEAHGDAAEIVAAAGADLALGQRLDRLALVELAAVDDHQLPQAGRDRLEGLQSHRFYPLTLKAPS